MRVRAGRFLDPVVPGHSLDKPGYEEAIVSALRNHVRQGDHVVVVGGGWGVSATVAAEQTGASGNVHVYEGAQDGVEHVHETAALNGCEDRITVEHAIVGQEVSLYSDSGDAPVLPGSEIPACDVLVLDCEGAELDILADLTIEPSTIIVETHGFLGAPVDDVRDRLIDLGYSVRKCTVAESANADYCEENGIYVLVATPTSATTD
ncbi:FkbM family methyltransferase [Halobacterium hubeiense]|uniref:FkbM family methyltransferase n=1 Tax=Halobacterium hubeiense TaxID=1407499 RepID=UPI003C78DE0F